MKKTLIREFVLINIYFTKYLHSEKYLAFQKNCVWLDHSSCLIRSNILFLLDAKAKNIDHIPWE